MDEKFCTVVEKDCGADHKCQLPFTCDKTKGTSGKCVLTSCNENDNTCAYPLTCEKLDGMDEKFCTNICTSQPCKNDGECKVDGSGFNCTCKEPWSGKTCEEGPCTSQPCKNGGECKVDGSGFNCTCREPWSGKTCEEDDKDKNPCEDGNPCKNGGTCEQKDGTGYECICVKGYNGKNCETIQWCQDNQDICGQTPCEYNEITESGFCFCKEGSYFNPITRTCAELDKCLFQRIQGNCSGDHETCIQGKCRCEDNYAYNEDRTSCEPDFCWKKIGKSRCGSKMECDEGDKTFTCFCKDGYRQIDGKCVKVNKCAPGISNCQQLCNNGNCSCFQGYQMNVNGYSCDPTTPPSECKLDCGKGICINDGTKAKCICPQISHVHKNGTCIDKCTANVVKNECPKKIDCLPDDDYGYKCNCTGKYGYAEDYVHCRAKQMCSEGDGNKECSLKKALCEDNFDLEEGYKCKCKLGYKENQDTGICEHMCETKGCDKKQALCIINVNNEAECICPPLLVTDSTGKCSRLAKFSYIGDFSVPKNQYQVVNAKDNGRSKRDTFSDIDYAKFIKEFEESMKKIFEDYKGTSILNCTDESDDWKCFLEIKLDKNPGRKINIVSTPSVCLPFSDDSHCLIPPNFVTKKRTADDAKVFHRTDLCDKNVIRKLCGPETQCERNSGRPGFKCKCRQGYSQRTYFEPADGVKIDVCDDINECLDKTICPNTTTCSNLPGDYTCKCKVGFHLEEGKSEKTHGCIAVCDPNPCFHGTCSESGKDGFSCSCDGSYTGRYCNQTNDALKDAKKEGKKISAIVGGVLGAILVVLIIICIIFFRKLKNSKPCDNSEDYLRHRNSGLISDMWKLGRRQPESKDMELRENERRPNRGNEDQSYPSQLRNNPIDSLAIPRPQLGRSLDKDPNVGRDFPERHESGDYRRGYDVGRDPERHVSSNNRRGYDGGRDPERHESSNRRGYEGGRDPERYDGSNNRKGYDGDSKMFPKPQSSRFSGDEYPRSYGRDDERQGLPRRPLSRSADHLDNEKIGVSRMQYRNRGYEED